MARSDGLARPHQAARAGWGGEHLEVQTRDQRWYVGMQTHDGSLFLSHNATVVYGDTGIGRSANQRLSESKTQIEITKRFRGSIICV